MSYHSRKHRTPLMILLILILFQLIVNNYSVKALLVINISLAIIILIGIIIEYEFVIEEDLLKYRLILFKMQIYQQVINPANIRQMNFKRVNWATKGSAIKMKNKLNVRVYGFKPDRVYNDLIDFAKVHSIPFIKSEDYKILERMKSRK